MPNSQTLRIKRIRRYLAALGSDIEHVLAWNEAVGMAYEERTGQPLEDGEAYSPADAERADEILLLFPKMGA